MVLQSGSALLPVAIEDATNPWGVNFQGGYFVTEAIELFGRYEYIDYNIEVPAGGSDAATKYNGVTLGMNWFMAGHNAKLTVDWSMNFNSFGTNMNAGVLNSIGWRNDVTATGATEPSKDQWALRAQMQLMF